MATTLAALAAGLVLTASATAAGSLPEGAVQAPFPAGTTLTPRDGTQLTPSYRRSLEFVLTSPDTGLDPFVEVATQPTLGQDGTLADDYSVDMVELTQSDASPNTYRGQVDTSGFGWTGRPGTYYIQAQAMKEEEGVDQVRGWGGPG